MDLPFRNGALRSFYLNSFDLRLLPWRLAFVRWLFGVSEGSLHEGKSFEKVLPLVWLVSQLVLRCRLGHRKAGVCSLPVFCTRLRTI